MEYIVKKHVTLCRLFVVRHFVSKLNYVVLIRIVNDMAAYKNTFGTQHTRGRVNLSLVDIVSTQIAGGRVKGSTSSTLNADTVMLFANSSQKNTYSGFSKYAFVSCGNNFVEDDR